MLCSAAYRAPVTAWLVSTLPAATAAGYSGDSIVRAGMITVSGSRQPALSGMSLSTRVRNTYRTAAIATLDGALKLLLSMSLVPVKSIVARRAVPVHGDLDLDDGAAVQFVAEAAVVQGGDHVPDRLRGVLPHVLHVAAHHVEAVLRGHLVQFLRALGIGGDLRPKVGEVGLRVTRRVFGACQQCQGLSLPEPPLVDEEPVVDEDALLLDPGAPSGHRAGRDSADLRVMAAGGDVEPDVAVAGLWGAVRREHRGDHGDVGQVRAAVIRVVERVDVARPDVPPVAGDHHLDRLAHRAEVHRDVRGVRDQVALGVEDRAGEVEALLDVDRVRRRAEPLAHLLGGGHEQVGEDLEQHRVGLGRRFPRSGRERGPARRHAGEQQVEPAGDRRPPAGLDDRGRQVLGDDRGAVHGLAPFQLGALVERDGQPFPRREQPDVLVRHGRRRHWLRWVRWLLARSGCRRLVAATMRVADGDRLDGDGLRHDGLVFHQEGEAGAVGALEGFRHLLGRAQPDLDGRVGAVVAQVDAAGHPDARAVRAMSGQLGSRGFLQVTQDPGRQPVRQVRGERRLDGAFPHRGHVGEADAVGGQRTGQRVDEHAGHAKRVGDRAGVLAARAAERGQHVPGHVVAALYGDLLDRVGHVLHRDLEEAGRDRGRIPGVPGLGGDRGG